MLADSLEQALEQLLTGADEVIETSCATVILKGERAYKLKKSVDFGFLDFTSAAKRDMALHRELQFNQRLASHIYLGVEAVAGESVLVMRRFDTAAVMAALAAGEWTPDSGLLRGLGQTIARFHAGSEICRDEGHADNIDYVITTSRDNFNRFRVELGAEAVDAYDEAITAAYAGLRPAILRRFDHGFVRHCHGDMHLGNILVEDGRPVLFDCIEFNDKLSQIDVLYDLAFLLMDLWVRGRREAANQVMNCWLEQAARLEDDPVRVYAGLALLPFYMSVRAGVRCHVTAHQGDLDAARMYLQAAREFLTPSAPRLLAIGGLSGSGKSTRARREAPDVGRAPGAAILRSDEIRKRLWAWPELETLPPAAYSEVESGRVLEDMSSLTQTVLATGHGVVVDATFRDSGWRKKVEGLAADAGAPFAGLWLDVPGAERAARISARTDDVSDATGAVALAQQPPQDVEPAWRVE